MAFNRHLRGTNQGMVRSTSERDMIGELTNVLGKTPDTIRSSMGEYQRGIDRVFQRFRRASGMQRREQIRSLRQEANISRMEEARVWRERENKLKGYMDEAKEKMGKAVPEFAGKLKDQIVEGVRKGAEKAKGLFSGLIGGTGASGGTTIVPLGGLGKGGLIGAAIAGTGMLMKRAQSAAEETERLFDNLTQQMMLQMNMTFVEAFRVEREIIKDLTEDYAEQVGQRVMTLDDWTAANQRAVDMGIRHLGVLKEMTEFLAVGSKILPSVNFENLEMTKEFVDSFEHGKEAMMELTALSRRLSQEFWVDPQTLFNVQNKFHRFVRVTSVDTDRYVHTMSKIQTTVAALEDSFIDAERVFSEVMDMAVKPITASQAEVRKLALLGLDPIQFRHLGLTDPAEAARMLVSAQKGFFGQWFEGGKFAGGAREAEQLRIIADRFGFDLMHIMDLMGGKLDAYGEALEKTIPYEEQFVDGQQQVIKILQENIHQSLLEQHKERMRQWGTFNKFLMRAQEFLAEHDITLSNIFIIGGMSVMALNSIFSLVGKTYTGVKKIGGGVLSAVSFLTKKTGLAFLFKKTFGGLLAGGKAAAGALPKLTGLGALFAKGGAVVKGAGTALVALGPVGWVLGLAALAIGGLVWYFWDDIKGFASKLFTETIPDMWTKSVDWITDKSLRAVDWVTDKYESSLEWIRDKIVDPAAEAWQWIKEKFSKYIIDPIGNVIKTFDIREWDWQKADPRSWNWSRVDPRTWGAGGPSDSVRGDTRRRGRLDLSESVFDKVTSDRGHRFFPQREYHTGIDLSTGGKEIPLKSNIAGYVDSVGIDRKLGHYLILDDLRGKYHLYGHLSRRTDLRKGSLVLPGQKLGIIGDSGRSTGTHLHYEVRRGEGFGTDVDPRPWLGGFGIKGPGVHSYGSDFNEILDYITDADYRNMAVMGKKLTGPEAIEKMLGKTTSTKTIKGISPAIGRYADYINRAAVKYNIDPALIAAIIHQESNFRPDVVSHAGAQGLMQLMPDTARGLGVTNPFDPLQNIMGGTRYIRDMYNQFKSWEIALAAYNAGPGNVRRYGNTIPPFDETQKYVPSVMGKWEDYRREFSRADGGMGGGDIYADQLSLMSASRAAKTPSVVTSPAREVITSKDRSSVVPTVAPPRERTAEGWTVFNRINSGYGMRISPTTGKWAMHHGIDYGAPTGTPIPSTVSGKVYRSEFQGTKDSGYGNIIGVRDPHGYGHLFAHMSRRIANIGDIVSQGTVLGLVGSTGASTGPHLHYEVRTNPYDMNSSVEPSRWVQNFLGSGPPAPLIDIAPLDKKLTVRGAVRDTWDWATSGLADLLGYSARTRQSPADVMRHFRDVDHASVVARRNYLEGDIYGAQLDLMQRYEAASADGTSSDGQLFLTYEDMSDSVKSWFERTPDVSKGYSMTIKELDEYAMRNRKISDKALKDVTGLSGLQSIPRVRYIHEAKKEVTPESIALGILKARESWHEAHISSDEIGMKRAHQAAEHFRRAAISRGFSHHLYDRQVHSDVLKGIVTGGVGKGDYLVKTDKLVEAMKKSPTDIAYTILKAKAMWSAADESGDELGKLKAHGIAETHRLAAERMGYKNLLYDRDVSVDVLKSLIEKWGEKEYQLDTLKEKEYPSGGIGGNEKVVETLVWTVGRLENKLDELKKNVDEREALYDYYRSRGNSKPSYASYD